MLSTPYPEILERIGSTGEVAVTSAVAKKVWRVAVGVGSQPGLAQGFFLKAITEPPVAVVAAAGSLFRRCASAQNEVSVR